MVLETWSEILSASFQQLWLGVMDFIPKLTLSLIIFIIGWVIAVTLDKLVARVIRIFRVDKALQGLGVEKFLERGGFRLDAGAFIGGLVKWFFIIAFMIAALDVLGLGQVNIFLQEVLAYLPSVIIAALILVAAAVIANAVQKVVSGSARGAGLPSAGFLGGIAKWSIWIFAILAALYQLGIAGPFVQTLFTGFVAMIVIAGGLAFGLGGRDVAARYIERLREDIANHNL
jgi:small-conductance mechanosensitive channel